MRFYAIVHPSWMFCFTFAKKVNAVLTKYSLKVNGETIEIPNFEIKNWDEIQCVWKRSDLGGVVRSFSSSFEFTGGTKDLLTSLYLRHGVHAEAMLFVYTITNNWTWSERFMTSLDFSTLSIESGSLKIKCIDNTISAIIKSFKSTKYEFKLGSDISPDCTMDLPRLPLIESATYEFTQDYEGKQRNDGSVLVSFNNSFYPRVGRIGDAEIVNGGQIFCAKDQKHDVDSSVDYCIKNIGTAAVDGTFEYNLRVSRLRLEFSGDIVLIKKRNNTVTGTYTLVKGTDIHGIATNGDVYWYSKFSEAPPAPTQANQFAVIGGEVYKSEEIKALPLPGQTSGKSSFYWESTRKLESDDDYSTLFSGSIPIHLDTGERLSIKGVVGYNAVAFQRAILKGQSLKFQWQTANKTVQVHGLSPEHAARSILQKMPGVEYAEVSISDFDSRLQHTYLFPAEELRAMPNAKFYSTFNSFCNWMETVFGYVYTAESYIREPKYKLNPSYKDNLLTASIIDPDLGLVSSAPVYDTVTRYSGNDPERVYFAWEYDRFVYKGDDGTYYYNWTDGHLYNTVLQEISILPYSADLVAGSPTLPIGKARTDVVFHNLTRDVDVVYNPDALVKLMLYTYVQTDWVETFGHKIHFLHRTELFKDGDPVQIQSIRDISVSIDNSYIYSTLSVGCKSKDYDSASGKDEFNFTSEYTTGIVVSGKKLQIVSDYRADSYGVEFCAQKAGNETSDNESDNDVFAILCDTQENSDNLIPSYEPTIEGAMSNKVFNGAFNPMACVEANKEFLAMASAPQQCVLTFASSDGNSSIIIGGAALNSNIDLGEALAMPMTLEFASDEDPGDAEFDRPYSVISDGMKYTGYLTEVKVKYAKNEAVTYKMIVKRMEAI